MLGSPKQKITRTTSFLYSDSGLTINPRGDRADADRKGVGESTGLRRNRCGRVLAAPENNQGGDNDDKTRNESAKKVGGLFHYVYYSYIIIRNASGIIK